jgi:hypothetical protein
MTIKALFPSIRPTLNLDFAKTKALDPRVTFTRASTATFVGSNGLIQTAASGAARFDHNPATGESLGLLVEEARTNLLTYSQTSAGWGYGAGGTISDNAGTAPDGTTSAMLVTNTTGGRGTPGAGTFTYSFFVKQGTSSTVRLIYAGYGGTDWIFTFATETLVLNTSSSGWSNGTVQKYRNGWYRISATTSSKDSYYYLLYADSASSTFNLWGAQIEAGSFPTSYIPTAGSTVTRAADVASMTGTNFSSWYNQSQGTLFGSFKTSTTDANMGLFAAYQASAATTNRISLRPRSSFADTAGAQQFFFNGVSVSTGQQTKMAWGFGSTATLYKDGTSAGTDSSVTLSSVIDTAIIGNFEPGSTGWTNGTIARITYYPARLPDAQLQALTAT